MDDDNEQWRPVVGYDGYEVSDQGRVRSLDRTVDGRDGRRTRFCGRLLKPTIGSHQYPVVPLGRGNVLLVHRLVLEAFCGLCPDGFEACHGNGVRHDVRLSNLRWDTHEANERDKGEHYYSKRTHCKHGHEFTPDNTRIQVLNNGHTVRHCRACSRDRNRAYQRRKGL